MSALGSLVVAMVLAGGAPLDDSLPWDGVTTRVVIDEQSGLRFPVPLTATLVESRHFPSARPGVQVQHLFTLSSTAGEVAEIALFENPKQLGLDEFVTQTLSFLRVTEHTELPWTATPAKVPALLFEHPRSSQQYARRAAVFALGSFVVVISCRNLEDRFAAGAFAALLAGLEVRR